MNDPDNFPGWRRLSDFEIEAMRRFTLDCRDLGDGDCVEISTEFSRSMCRALDVVVRELGRFPTDVEVTILGRAVVRFFNETVIPEFRARRSLH